MKQLEVTRMAAQGDVLFRKVSEIPTNAKEVAVPKDRRLIVAHSETGHHHVIEDFHGQMFQVPDEAGLSVCYLRVEGATNLGVTHHRPYDTHDALKLMGGGIWEVRRQRENAPEGWRQVRD